MVETESQTSDSDSDHGENHFALASHGDPVVRLATWARTKQFVMSLKGKELTDKDREILRGIFLRNFNNSVEYQEERLGRLTLLERVKRSND